jgi:hypothetical protein
MPHSSFMDLQVEKKLSNIINSLNPRIAIAASAHRGESLAASAHGGSQLLFLLFASWQSQQ